MHVPGPGPQPETNKEQHTLTGLLPMKKSKSGWDPRKHRKALVPDYFFYQFSHEGCWDSYVGATGLAVVREGDKAWGPVVSDSPPHSQL